MSFDLQPILNGELVRLRPLRPEDFHGLYAVASDPLIWEQYPIKDRYKEEVFRAFFHETVECGGTLTAIDSKDGRVGIVLSIESPCRPLLLRHSSIHHPAGTRHRESGGASRCDGRTGTDITSISHDSCEDGGGAVQEDDWTSDGERDVSAAECHRICESQH
jgi:hypothetical protein